MLRICTSPVRLLAVLFLCACSFPACASEETRNVIEVSTKVFELVKEKYGDYWKSRSILYVCDKKEVFHLMDAYESSITNFSVAQLSEFKTADSKLGYFYVDGMQLGYLYGLTEAYANLYGRLSKDEKAAFCVKGMDMANDFLSKQNKKRN